MILHNSTNLAVEGSYFADKRQGVEVNKLMLLELVTLILLDILNCLWIFLLPVLHRHIVLLIDL